MYGNKQIIVKYLKIMMQVNHNNLYVNKVAQLKLCCFVFFFEQSLFKQFVINSR
ncbi:hypothetical protein GCM10011351_24900 [Paraliobacillus quinghaiensis]|uniref:Uncharacterized protein n=1 Tax=Paraliobacillus quinghaiensis TaxID=470815 RepID=A0A917TTP2_9BACI|nr:hypothetical protein GCM10011351_24900 [Paraliobacillus quinghaiensis]